MTITLTGTDVNGNAVSRTATTDAAGGYRFADLVAGTYTLSETQPAGYRDGLETVGSLGGRKDDDLFFAVVVPAGAAGVGSDFGGLLLSDGSELPPPPPAAS